MYVLVAGSSADNGTLQRHNIAPYAIYTVQAGM